jgi:hypothetical protein
MTLTKVKAKAKPKGLHYKNLIIVKYIIDYSN